MYARDTILTLKKQQDPDPETDEAFAYNKVRVIGESPIQHTSRGEYQGEDARGVIIVPIANFGGTLDEPFGKLRQLYDVTEVPETMIQPPAPIRVIDSASAQAGLTPEEVFREKAPGTPPEAGQIRGRTLKSPLSDPGPESARGPLDR
jgi:hypothetical protein